MDSPTCQTGRLLCGLLVATVLLTGGVSRGQEAPPPPALTLKMTVAREVKTTANGKTVITYEPVEKSRKGDVLKYTISYSNDGKVPLKDAAMVGPVPIGTTYVADSAAGPERASLVVSADAGRSFAAAPLKEVVANAQGVKEERVIPPERYTHLRWQLLNELPAGAKGEASFKVTVQ